MFCSLKVSSCVRSGGGGGWTRSGAKRNGSHLPYMDVLQVLMCQERQDSGLGVRKYNDKFSLRKGKLEAVR
jgi:hypothetical protein